MLLIDSNILRFWHWLFNASIDDWVIQKGNTQRLAFPCGFKAVVSDCITTQNDKLPDFEVSCPENPAPHLETISFAACHQKSYTFHTFPPRLQIFPCPAVRQAVFMSGKGSYHFSLQSRTNHRPGPRFLATNHKITVDFLGNRTNYLVGRKRERGVIYPRIPPWIYYTVMLLRAYQNSLGWYTGIANNEHVYITSLTSK